MYTQIKNNVKVEKLIELYKRKLEEYCDKDDILKCVEFADLFVGAVIRRYGREVLSRLEERLINAEDILEFHLLGATGKVLKKQSEEDKLVLKILEDKERE